MQFKKPLLFLSLIATFLLLSLIPLPQAEATATRHDTDSIPFEGRYAYANPDAGWTSSLTQIAKLSTASGASDDDIGANEDQGWASTGEGPAIAWGDRQQTVKAKPNAMLGDFEYKVTDNTVTITKYTGSGGAVVIPETIDSMPVVAIEGSSVGQPSYYGAFQGCTGLTSITIPSTVKIIGYNSFHSTGLASVTIPYSVTSIGGYAFHNCSSLTSVSIGSGVASIGDEAFYDCSNLTSLDIAPGNPVYTSQDGVLYNKAMTKLIQYPSGKSGAFAIPNGVTSIGDVAFYKCTRLPSVTIPGSVTSMYGYLSITYNFCPEYPPPVPCNWDHNDINYGSFSDCDNLSSVYFEGTAPNIVYDGNCNSLPPETVYCDMAGPFIRHAYPFTVYYNANCSTGFTNPWYGYPTAVFTAPCTTISTTTTTTTTIPAEPCSVDIFPRRLSKMINTVVDLQAFILRGDENSSFSKATDIDWGTSSVETLVQAALNKRLIIALVLVNGSNQEVGDIYDVTVDNCSGELPVKMF